jgi:hypothetical protein
MNRFRWLGLLIVALLVVGSVMAQAGNPWVAFVNESGQLVVTDANGASRWIVTNPGEKLHPVLGYTWAPDGTHLLVATQDGGGALLRLGDVNSQTLTDFGRLDGSYLSGGVWQNNNTVLFSDGQAVYAVTQQNQTPVGVGELASPFADMVNPTLPSNVLPLSLLSGQYALGDAILPGDQANGRSLWASNAPLVAYGAFDEDGASAVFIANAQSGTTIRFNSGGRTPIFPEGWLANTSQLLFRDGAGQIRWVDVSCLQSSCGSDPFASSVVILPASASEVQASASQLLYRDQDQIWRTSLNCIQQQNCYDTAQQVGSNAAPRTPLLVRGSTALYTAYGASQMDTSDRTVYGLDLNCGDCVAQPLVSNATAVSLDASGQNAVVESAGQGIALLRVNDLSQVYLAGPSTNSAYVRWNR